MKVRINLKILILLIIFYITHQLRNYVIIMFFSVFHEIGHILTGTLLKVKLKEIEIMPFGFSTLFEFEEKDKLNIVKEILIAISGPITSFIILIIYKNINISKYIIKQEAIYANLLIMLFNLIPIYPLDGGRILKGIIQIKLGTLKAEKLILKISEITIIILTIISSISIYYYKNIAIFLICIFLWKMTLKEKNVKSIDILR